jgi:hypothetical protein
MPDTRPPAWFAVAVASTLAGIAGIVGLTATAGVSGSMVLASAAGVTLAAMVFVAVLRSGTVRSRLASAPPALRIVCSAGALLLVGQLAFAAAFTIHPTLTRWDPRPWAPQRSNHSCVSAYWVACQAVTRTDAIYDERLYSLPQADPAAVRRARTLGPFLIDNYEYPPAFLALPRLVAAVTPDFWAFRRVWFALMLAVTAAGIVAVARSRCRSTNRFRGCRFKLALFGMPHMGFTASKIVGWVYTAVVIAVIARLARRPTDQGLEPLAWLAILVLATMRSPFLPSYAPFPSLWLATLLAGLTWGRSRTWATAVGAWAVLAFSFGAGGAPIPVNAIWTFAHTVAAFVLVVLACRVTAPAPAAVPSPRAAALAPT